MTPKGVVHFPPPTLHVWCMQSVPRRRSYQRAPTTRCSSCCTSCPPAAAMLWSCSQSPLSSQVLPFALPRQCLSQFSGTAFHHVQAVPFTNCVYCLSPFPCTAFHDLQAVTFTVPTYCLLPSRGNAYLDSHVLPIMMSRQCLSQSPVLPSTISRQCLSWLPRTAFYSFNAAFCCIGTSALHHACCY